MARTRLGVLAVLATSALAVPGCIVQEIRDDLRKTSELLDTRLAVLDDTNRLLGEIKADLEKTQQELGAVKAELTRTNQTMVSVEKSLEVLEPINKSLVSLDDSLKTVKGLIEKIPFVGSSKDSEKEKPAEGKPAEPAPAAKPDGDK